jgi:hypothetical protein
MTEQRKSEMAGDRPGTRTAADEYNHEEITGSKDGQGSQGKLVSDPTRVFEERQKTSPHGERDFSNDPKRAAKVGRRSRA